MYNTEYKYICASLPSLLVVCNLLHSATTYRNPGTNTQRSQAPATSGSRSWRCRQLCSLARLPRLKSYPAACWQRLALCSTSTARKGAIKISITKPTSALPASIASESLDYSSLFLNIFFVAGYRRNTYVFSQFAFLFCD